MRQFAVVCDFKLFLFDTSGDKPPQISQSASLVIDMRWVLNPLELTANLKR